MVSCGSWSGATSAPTCSGQASSPSVQACGVTGSGTSVGIGVWNINTCRLTSGVTNGCPNQKEVGLDFSGYPVVYETPIMTAYQKFVDTLLKHYSSHGDTNGGVANGPAIGAYISYIRVGLTSGGEDFPVCAQSLVNNTTTGVWPSPQGLNYDLTVPNGAISPDWYETTAVCPGGVNDEAACRGKYAYLLGSPNGITLDGNGYVATMFKAFQASRSTYYGTGGPQVVANAHTGPPSLTDMSYADQEASSIIGSTLPGCGGYCGKSGFGQESLSEYDVWSLPIGRACDDDWCHLFQEYSPTFPGNYFLQTTLPNSKAVYPIHTISTATPYLQGLVTCSSPCTNFNTSPPAFSPSGLYPQEGFAITANGATKSYKIATNGTDSGGNPVGVLSSTQFTCDTNTFCPTIAQNQNQILYTGDYLPDTVSFAGRTDASTIEVYFCDWEFALNSNSSQTTTGCQAYDSVYSPKYATVLDPP
jgi:hypothetical protein